MKRIIAIIMTTIMAVTVFTACSSSGSAGTADLSGGISAESEGTKINDYSDSYLDWKVGNWVQASDEDKENCAKAYLGYMGDLMGLKMTDADFKNISNTVEDLDKAFNASTKLTLREIILYGLSDHEDDSSSAE